MSIEYRKHPFATELRMTDAADKSLKRISGYAAVFNRLSEDLGGYREKIAPGAFANSLRRRPDVKLLINHQGLPLARTLAGNLRLREDSHGLHFEADVNPRDPDFLPVVEKIRTGVLNQVSFGFRVLADKWEHAKETGKRIRTLLEIALYEVSLVTFPAYPQTVAVVRTRREEIEMARAARERQLALHRMAGVELAAAMRERKLKLHRSEGITR